MNQTAQWTIAQRVQNGCRWLDENFPGWEERIDIHTLDLANGHQCICGQVFAEEARDNKWSGHHGFDYAYSNFFQEANSWIPFDKQDPKRRVLVAHYLGFYSGSEKYAGLKREWKKVLRQREVARNK